MKKLYNSNIFWLIVSLLLSLAIWVYVTSIENDDFKQTFRGVQIEVIGESALKTSKNMVITDLDTSYVTIDVTGPRRIVGSLSSSDIVAQLDVSKLSRVSYTSQQYSVVFPDRVDTSKITVTKKTPETVSFVVSNMAEKTIQVKGSFVGSIAEGYKSQKAEFEPSTITVSGPEVYLKNIDYAWVTFGAEDIMETYSTESFFQLMDEQGNEIPADGLSFSSDSVIARLPIIEVRNVPLAVNIVYGAGATEENTSVVIEPQYITLSGDSLLLNDYNQIVLGTIDATKFSAKTEEMSFTIKFDNELNNDTGITEALVTVEISGLSTRTFTVGNIQKGTPPEGFDAEIVSEQLTVTLRGIEEELEKISADDIAAIIDWSDFNAAVGNQELPAKIRVDLDGVSSVGAIFDYTVSVDVKKA